METKNPLRIFNSAQLKRIQEGEHQNLKRELLLLFQLSDDVRLDLNGFKVDRNELNHIFSEVENNLDKHLSILKDEPLYNFLNTHDLSHLKEWEASKVVSLDENTKDDLISILKKKLYPMIFSDKELDQFKILVKVADYFDSYDQEFIYSDSLNKLLTEFNEHEMDLLNCYNNTGEYCKVKPAAVKYINYNIFERLSLAETHWNVILDRYSAYCERAEMYRNYFYKNAVKIPKKEIGVFYHAAKIQAVLNPTSLNKMLAKDLEVDYLKYDKRYLRMFYRLVIILFLIIAPAQFIIYVTTRIPNKDSVKKKDITTSAIIPEHNELYKLVGGKIESIEANLAEVIVEEDVTILEYTTNFIPLDYKQLTSLIPDSILHKVRSRNYRFIWHLSEFANFKPQEEIGVFVYENENMPSVYKNNSMLYYDFSVTSQPKTTSWIGKYERSNDNGESFGLVSRFDLVAENGDLNSLTIFPNEKSQKDTMHMIGDLIWKHPARVVFQLTNNVNKVALQANTSGSLTGTFNYSKIGGNYLPVTANERIAYTCMKSNLNDSHAKCLFNTSKSCLAVYIDVNNQTIDGILFAAKQAQNEPSEVERIVMIKN